MNRMMWKLGFGLVGGLVGTVMMQQMMKVAGRLPERVRPPMPTSDPGDVMVHKTENVVGALPRRMRKIAVQGMHFGYGALGPLALAAISGAIGARSTGKTVMAGTLLGALVWAAGYAGWLPALDLVPPVHKVPLTRSASGLMGHLAYGALAVLPLALAAPRVERLKN